MVWLVLGSPGNKFPSMLYITALNFFHLCFLKPCFPLQYILSLAFRIQIVFRGLSF